MISGDIRLPNIEELSALSGLPEDIMANDVADEIQKEMVRLGKPEKEAAGIVDRLRQAFVDERKRAVEACYLAGYLKGTADMSQRFKTLLESRGTRER